MVDLLALLNDAATMIASCPEVAEELNGNSDGVLVYEDVATTVKNSLTRSVYEQPNGSVLLAWIGSAISVGEMEGWQHQVDIYVRALRQKSPLKLLNAIIDGIPYGQDLRWRYQCVNDAVLPVTILEIVRVPDEEGIDFYQIRCAFVEKSD
jgi:hypothetical protein